MEKFLSVIGTLFALFVTVSMVSLFDYNTESVGLLFAIAMVSLGFVTTVMLVVHYYLNHIKK
jgi:uncharacterized membrane protein